MGRLKQIIKRIERIEQVLAEHIDREGENIVGFEVDDDTEEAETEDDSFNHLPLWWIEDRNHGSTRIVC